MQCTFKHLVLPMSRPPVGRVTSWSRRVHGGADNQAWRPASARPGEPAARGAEPSLPSDTARGRMLCTLIQYSGKVGLSVPLAAHRIIGLNETETRRDTCDTRQLGASHDTFRSIRRGQCTDPAGQSTGGARLERRKKALGATPLSRHTLTGH